MKVWLENCEERYVDDDDDDDDDDDSEDQDDDNDDDGDRDNGCEVKKKRFFNKET